MKNTFLFFVCLRFVFFILQLVTTYSCRRKTRRWPLVLFYNVLDTSAYNSYVLWTSIDPSWEQRKSFRWRLFLEELGGSLIAPLLSMRQRLPQTLSSARTAARPTPIPISTRSLSRKRCRMCTTRRQVFSTCRKCGVAVCKEHYVTVCIYCYQ